MNEVIVRRMNEVTEITPHLYVCGEMAINDEMLTKLGITLIINSAGELRNYETTSEDLQLTFVKVPVRDTQTLLYPYFKAISELIQANKLAGGKSLVHCIAGISRSVSLCAAYLMTNRKLANVNRYMSAKEAVLYIQERRRFAKPNPDFMSQLIQYEKDLPIGVFNSFQTRQKIKSQWEKEFQEEYLEKIENITEQLKSEHCNK